MKVDRYFGMSTRIARWKLNTSIEKWLSFKADRSEFWKFLYILYYRVFDAAYYRGGVRMLNTIIEEDLKLDERRSKGVVIRDMLYCLHRFGFSFQDYCIYDFLHHTSFEYRNSFVADKLRYYYCDLLNAPNVLSLMTDKYSCYLSYKDYYKREVLGCFSEKDYDAFENFVSRHTEFIFKPLNEHSGLGIERYQAHEISPDEFFTEKIKIGAFVLEEIIVQGAETSAIHPQSVNSCRVVTFYLDGVVHVLAVAWRIGSGKSIKDNAGAGGVYTAVNPLTGVVETDAMNYKCDVFTVHPDTGIKFQGYQLPQWDQALQLIESLAKQVDGTTLIAWDIAYSKKGWLMIEANDNGDWSIVQSNKKHGLKDELYSYMDQYFK